MCDAPRRWLVEAHPIVAERKGITVVRIEVIEGEQKDRRKAGAGDF